MPRYLIKLGAQVGVSVDELSFEVERNEPPTEDELDEYLKDALGDLVDMWAVYEEIKDDKRSN